MNSGNSELIMGEAEEDRAAGCSFSLVCLEDGADLGGGVDDGKLLLLYGEAEEEEEEYMGHLVSKESSFCSSPSPSSSPASSSDAGAESPPSPVPSSEDWFRRARRDTVKWIIEVNEWSSTSFHASFTYLHSFLDAKELRACLLAPIYRFLEL